MADSNLAQIEHYSQQLTNKFKKIEDLMSRAWLEHELARESFRALLKTHYQWLGKQGIEYEP